MIKNDKNNKKMIKIDIYQKINKNIIKKIKKIKR